MPDEITLIVSEHNRLRKLEEAADMHEIVWNQQLANMSLDIAMRCSGDHSQFHERLAKAGFEYTGESLFWSTNYVPVYVVIRAFHSERSAYDLETNSCFLRPGARLHECGHYTQIVNAKTCSVGCAYAYCPHVSNGRSIKSGYMVTCKYGPGLDYSPDILRPYIKGPRCSMCNYGKQHCLKTGLCPACRAIY